MKKIASILIFTLLYISLTAQTTYYVKATGGNDSNAGTSWSNAFLTLQAALDVAVSGDKIWVAKGTYKPTKISGDVPGTDERDKAFAITNGVSVYGGFSGTETSDYDISFRNFLSNKTTLSGNIAADENDSYHVVVVIGKNGNVSLDGFTITGGNANGTGNVLMNEVEISRRQGGGVNVQTAGSEVRLVNNIIRNNLSANWGGGLFINSGATASGGESFIINNYIHDNDAASSIGGGAYAFVNNAAVHMVNNVIYKNKVTANNAGGVYINIQKAHNAYFINNTIANNTSATGALYCYTPGAGTVHVANTIIHGNNPNTIAGHSSNVGDILVSYCLVSGGVVAERKISASQIIDNDPLFSDVEYGDYSLTSNSVARDAGNNTAYQTNLYGHGDVEGNRRVHQNTIDLGAYEYGAPTIASVDNPLSQISVYISQTDLINIKGLEGFEYITVVDINGRKLFDAKATNSEMNLPFNAYKAGVYILRIANAASTRNFKLLKR